MVVPQNGWFIKENLIRMDNLGVPPFMEPSIHSNVLHLGFMPIKTV